MFTYDDTGPRLLHSRPSAAALMRAAVDPSVVIGTLFFSVLWFDRRFDGACLILALLVFAMTFPGSLARATRASAAELARDIAAGWLAVVGLLLLLGWATHTLAAFDERVLLAWALAHAAGAVRRAPPAARDAAAPARGRGHAQGRR